MAQKYQYHIEIANDPQQYLVSIGTNNVIDVCSYVVRRFSKYGKHIRIYVVDRTKEDIKLIQPIVILNYVKRTSGGMWYGKSARDANTSVSRFIFSPTGRFIADEIYTSNGKWKAIPFSDTKYYFEQ